MENLLLPLLLHAFGTASCLKIYLPLVQKEVVLEALGLRPLAWDVCLVCVVLSGRGLCEVVCNYVCGLETSRMRRLSPELGRCARGKFFPLVRLVLYCLTYVTSQNTLAEIDIGW
jgi:hypothetical protein